MLLPLLSKEFPLGMSGKKGPDVAGDSPARLGAETFMKSAVQAREMPNAAGKKASAKKAAAKKTGGQKTYGKKPAAKKAAVKKPAKKSSVKKAGGKKKK